MANELISDIPVTATSIGTSDLFEILSSGTSKQIAWSSILGTVQTWTGAQTFVAPVLGAATATSINKVAITTPTTGSTLTIADGKTLTVSNTATVSGTNTGDQTSVSGSSGSCTGNAATATTAAACTGNSATVTTNANLTGDVTSVGNATTLATVNGNVGSFTNANITVNAKGLVTAAANGSAGGSGTVTSVVAGSGLSGGTITTTGTISLNLANSNSWTATQNTTITDSATTTVTTLKTLDHETSGTPGAGFGGQIIFALQDSTTASQNAGAIQTVWGVATHASHSSKMILQSSVNGGALSNTLIIGRGDASTSTQGLIIGGVDSTGAAIWASGLTPASPNFGLYISSGSGTIVNAPTGTTVILGINNTTTATITTSALTLTTSDLKISTIGNGLQIKTGANSRIGTGTLSGGTLTVANTSVTANTRVFLTDTTSGSLTNVGQLTVVTTAGTGFVVTSSNVLDTSTFNFILIESIP